MGETTTRMKVIELVMDWKLWPRHEANKLDSTNLSKLRDVLRAGREFSTPIIAERKSLRIVDGFHRVHVLLDEVGDDAEADVTLKDYENEVAARIDAARGKIVRNRIGAAVGKIHVVAGIADINSFL